MISDSAAGVVQRGRLLVYIAENGLSFRLDVDENTLVESVQRDLESLTGIQYNDQLLLCLDMKLEPQRHLSFYRLPSDGREVFVFNIARMKGNSSPPPPEQAEAMDIPNTPPSTSSNNPHPLADAPDPAMKALPSYERQFRYHFQYGHVIYNCTLAKMDICEKLFRQVKVQEKALEIAGRNLDHYYKMILQNYRDFEKFNSHQYRRYTNLLVNFGRDVEKLKSCKLMPLLQADNRKCLFDFVKEENLQKVLEDCAISHRQFENKASEFKQEIGELKLNAEHLSSSKTSFLIGELEATIQDHQRHINELKSVMQTLSKDVSTVKKLVDECLTSQLSSSLCPHDAVSASGPIYENHEKSCLPMMQSCDNAISQLLDYCQKKKNEMNIFVHNYIQKIAYVQYMIKEIRFKFSVFQEALKCRSDQFEHLRVVHGIGPAYRACLAEVVRLKETMKLYMGMAGQLAERIASKREVEVRRREEFLKEISLFIPRDILASMGLYGAPSQCDVNITPFDTNLIDINLSDVDRYAPEQLLGFSLKHDKPETSKSSFSEEISGFPENPDSEELIHEEDSELLVEIAEIGKLEVENAKLRAELASKIALLCSISAEFDYELLDDESKVERVVKNAVGKKTEALHLKSEYEKHLQLMLKPKHMQCESYEKRIAELEHRLSDQFQSLPSISRQETPHFDPSTRKIEEFATEEIIEGEPLGLMETLDEGSSPDWLSFVSGGESDESFYTASSMFSENDTTDMNSNPVSSGGGTPTSNPIKKRGVACITKENIKLLVVATKRPLFVGTKVKKGVCRRKHHILWSMPEVRKLVDGVSRHGVGRWGRIKNELFSKSPHRTAVDLKDKWRNLLKAVYTQREKEGKKRNLAWRPLPKSIMQRVSELSIKYPYPRDLRSLQGY